MKTEIPKKLRALIPNKRKMQQFMRIRNEYEQAVGALGLKVLVDETSLNLLAIDATKAPDIDDEVWCTDRLNGDGHVFDAIVDKCAFGTAPWHTDSLYLIGGAVYGGELPRLYV